jgi:Spy/CpxP family protein refolding chaperone
MKRSPMKWWKLAPALLLAGMTWSGFAAAGDDNDGRKGKGEFDGPGGMSAPADPDRRSDRMERGGKRGERHGMRRGGAGMRGGKGQHGRMGRGMRGGRGDMMARLNLTDRQKEQIKTIREQQQRRMIPLNARLQEANLDLRQLLQADRPNQARIDAAIDQVAGLRADAHKARVASMLEIKGLLTDAQKKQLREQRGSMRGWGGGGGRGGMRHDGGGMKNDNSGAAKVRGAGRSAA